MNYSIVSSRTISDRDYSVHKQPCTLPYYLSQIIPYKNLTHVVTYHSKNPPRMNEWSYHCSIFSRDLLRMSTFDCLAWNDRRTWELDLVCAILLVHQHNRNIFLLDEFQTFWTWERIDFQLNHDMDNQWLVFHHLLPENRYNNYFFHDFESITNKELFDRISNRLLIYLAKV